ncbi:MAG: 1-deoxy-D-xylulose-5-phosphate synthase [Kiritimatiellae bacterium]|nr:1-deoxy-D-xylulose-5-phosphate synthase [Kiritimatiellia bacterium]
MTAHEIRRMILESVSKNGGHLASSLGAVELAMALADVFEPERDRIVWDVGHQAYAWKILTGRAGSFGTLRTLGGISGFPNPSESPADAAVAGHAGVALSIAEGYAAARDLRGSGEHVVAVVGDSSLVNGTSFEALNNCVAATKKVILVLNDNGMSISKPAGSFSRFLGRLISGVRYNRVKAAAEKAGHALKLTFLRSVYHGLETRIKSLFLGNRYFEQFGLRYIGPVDGHDLKALKAALTVAKEDKRSVIVHVVTKKGRGYPPAEKDPTKWHGVGPFPLVPEIAPLDAPAPSAGPLGWSDAFGGALCRVAERDPRVVALTAGMADGTGLREFADRFRGRFYDVGISEGHMVSFAAGLAAGGMRPFVAVYSTFLQRAADQVMHDVCLSSLPVVFCVDRAGVVGADGVTHQGVFDIAMLRAFPNLTICQPRDAEDLAKLLDEALLRNGPTVIRYPRGKIGKVESGEQGVGGLSCRLEFPHPGKRPGVAIWATGDWYAKACEVARRVGGVAVHARYIKPFDAELLARQRADGMRIVSLENGSVAGGLGEAIGAELKFGWPDEFIPHGSQSELERKYGLDAEGVSGNLT